MKNALYAKTLLLLLSGALYAQNGDLNTKNLPSPSGGANQQAPLIFTPTKDDNPLNGVTTYDLVLISRHLLFIEPLGSPYRMIAADANKSNSITTFDIVQLRSLILGIYTELPNNTSWRFVDADHVFSDPNNPFTPSFPEFVDVDNSPPASHVATFRALKVGDVNESALYDLRPAGPAAGIAYAVQAGVAAGTDATVSVPVYARETLTASGWQMALRYDPARFKLKNVRITGPELAGNLNNGWYEPTPGEVRILWFDAEAQTYTYHEGASLFYLDMEALDQTAGFTMDIDEQVLYAETYDSNGAVRRFALERGVANAVQPPASEHMSASLWSARVYPNPNTGVFRLHIDLPEAGGVTLQLTDQHGSAIHRQELKLLKGDNLIGPDKLPRLQPGAYILHINTALGAQQIPIIVSDRR
jgi:hypothetical protein